MARILRWTGVALGTLLLALLLWYLFVFDWNDIKGHLATAVGERTRREFSVGDLDVRLSLTPRIRLERVRLENAGWSPDAQMVQIGSLEFTLRLMPLLRGRVVLPEVTLERPRLVLERNREGVPNWDFSADPAGELAVETAVPVERGEFPLIGRLRIADGTLVYRDPARDIDIESSLTTAVGSRQPDDEQVRLEGQGRFEGLPFSLQFTGGSLLALRESDDPYPLRAQAAIGDTRIRVQGSARDPLRGEGLNLRTDLEGRDLSEVFPIFGIPLPATRPYRITGALSRDGKQWRFEDFAGAIGESDLSGDLQLDFARTPPYLGAHLSSDQLQLSELASFFAVRPEPEPKSDRVIPATTVDLVRLQAMDMDVALHAQRVVAADVPVREVEYRLHLEGGRLRISPLRFAVANGTIAGAVHLDAAREPAHLRLDLQLRQLQLGRFLPELGPASGYGVFGGRVRVDGRGADLPQMLANGDGGLWLSMSGGAVDELLLAAAGIDVPDLLRLMGAEQAPVPLRCSVVSFDLDDGRLKSNVVVVDAQESTLIGNGTIDLRDESLDLRLDARAKEPSALTVGGAIEIEGRLGNPSIGLDLSGAAGQLGAAAALGAVAGPLAAILPFLDPGTAEDAECSALFAQARRSVADS